MISIFKNMYIKEVSFTKGAYLPISFWHLLIKLKNNCLLKKLLPIKNVKILIFAMLYFFKEIKKYT